VEWVPPEEQPLAEFIHINITDQEDIKGCVHTLKENA